MSNENNIPSGSYACTLVPREDGQYSYPIDVDPRSGAISVKIKLHLWAKGSEQPFTEIESLQCIDAAAAARSSATNTTPYEFMQMSLRNLGAESNEAIDDAVINGLASEDQSMVFPGTPKAAICEISYKAGNRGGSFMNEKIMPFREVTQDARAKAIEAAKQRKAQTAPQATPFGPAPGRSVPVRPPAVAR